MFFIKKGNADTFYEQLQQLNVFLKHEWVSQGNQAKDFQTKGSKVIVTLNNASYHKRLDTRDRIAQELWNVVLEFLPVYIPDFNIIEFV